MSVNTDNDNPELKDILYPRLPPHFWDVIGYGGGLIAIFYYNKVGIISYSCSFVLYGLLNIIFDFFTVSFDYSNNKMPDYNNIGNYKYYITNKKYKIQITEGITYESREYVSRNISRLIVELSIYVGENHLIKYFLFFIYLIGITKKNYTIREPNVFKKINDIFVR